MTIALLTDGIFPLTLGGIQKHSYYIAKDWVQQGVQLQKYHPNKYSSADLDKYLTQEEHDKLFVHIL